MHVTGAGLDTILEATDAEAADATTEAGNNYINIARSVAWRGPELYQQ